MNFEFSDEQQLLREQAQSFLEDNCSIKKVRETFESDSPYNLELWKKIKNIYVVLQEKEHIIIQYLNVSLN